MSENQNTFLDKLFEIALKEADVDEREVHVI